MIIKTHNQRKAGQESKIIFISCSGSEISINLKCSNVKRTVKKDPDLFTSLCEVAVLVNTYYHSHPMTKLFKSCKARVDMHRYFNDMPISNWNKL